MFCPNCGKEYPENQNFCRFCGQKLFDDLNNAQDSSPAENENVSDLPQDINQEVDLTIQNDCPIENEQNVNSPISDNIATEEQNSSMPELKDEVEEKKSQGLFYDLQNTLIEETENGKKPTTYAIILLVVLFLFILFMGNLLWSINDAIQINPSMTNENALMNIPNDDENGSYTQPPMQKQEDDENSENEQDYQQNEATYAEEPQLTQEPPLVPIEEIRQMEQQFPEPEIPFPQENSEETEP